MSSLGPLPATESDASAPGHNRRRTAAHQGTAPSHTASESHTGS